MGLIREPKNVDFYIKSEPWTEEETNELRAIIKKSKAEKLARKTRRIRQQQTPAKCAGS